jgi:putative oxygen-independent coproporphyrinogen III oxidase
MIAVGLYVHVPFCRTRCGYCDFNAYAGLDDLAPRYVRALAAEASLVAPAWGDARFTTVFVGGGTPTTLPPASLERLLAELRAILPIDDDAEVTIEANPETVDEGSLGRLRAAGYRRLSLGAQSFDRVVLARLERGHDPDAVGRAVRAARGAGFDNVNLDLIYGVDGEGLASWRETLRATIALGPEHVSAYALTVEPATPLGRQVADGLRPAPDPDVQADMYEQACELLGAAGYRHYEVSNWARPGFECRHNLGYWRRHPYLGLGAGAHSARGPARWWNLRPPRAYLASVEAGSPPVGGAEELTSEQIELEERFLRLRTREGVAPDGLDPAVVDGLVDAGLLERAPAGLIPTERGLLLVNELVLALEPQRPRAPATAG